MGKPYPNKNGFTLIEMLVVLLIVSMLGFGLSTKMHCSLYVFMKNLQTLCITAQEKAYVKHRKVYVEIGDSIYMDDVEYKIPHDIACDHVSFYYNAKGNMSKAMSLHCQNASSQMKLVFQVGAGRVRLEKEEWLFTRRCLVCVLCDFDLCKSYIEWYLYFIFSKESKD